jgi:hypothetical protein
MMAPYRTAWERTPEMTLRQLFAVVALTSALIAPITLSTKGVLVSPSRTSPRAGRTCFLSWQRWVSTVPGERRPARARSKRHHSHTALLSLLLRQMKIKVAHPASHGRTGQHHRHDHRPHARGSAGRGTNIELDSRHGGDLANRRVTVNRAGPRSALTGRRRARCCRFGCSDRRRYWFSRCRRVQAGYWGVDSAGPLDRPGACYDTGLDHLYPKGRHD